MPDPRPLSGQQDRAWSLLVGVLMWLPAELDTYLDRAAGLSHAEYQVLHWLSVSEDREVHMGRLAATANVTPSHLSRIVSRLEKRQWITRSNDPDDARRTLARLTDTGAQLLDRVEPGYAEQVRRHVFDRLDGRQAEQLEDVAEAVLTSLHPDCLAIMPARTPREHA